MFAVRCVFLLIHFLVVEDYKLPKGTSHILSVPLIWNKVVLALEEEAVVLVVVIIVVAK